jgi:hypothetical protein
MYRFALLIEHEPLKITLRKTAVFLVVSSLSPQHSKPFGFGGGSRGAENITSLNTIEFSLNYENGKGAKMKS